MSSKIIYLIFGLLLLSLRLIFNYSFELIPGINGGYYPLQLRSLLETGQLGFSDMPLYFYLTASFVKMTSFFTAIDIGHLIIHTSKIIDSISLPLLVIPLYLIVKNIFKDKLPRYFEIILVGFATLSFSPLILTSDLQKNAFAIPLMLFFIYYLLAFFKSKSKKHIFLSVIFIMLTGLTHFGVFSVSVLILLISLIVFYRKKALLPIFGISVLGILWVYIFDPGRAESLLNLWPVIFEKPAILQQGPLSPQDLFNYIMSYLLIGFGVFKIIKRKQKFNFYRKNILIIFLTSILILSFPLLDIQYARRFSLLLFIPQIFVLCILFRFFNQKLRKIICSLLVLMTMGSIFLMTVNMKPPSITQQAFQDLKNLEKHISDPGKTLIIARHGLEWWTAWQIHTKVGQDKSLTEKTNLKYDKILILVQLDGINQMHPRQKSPFHEPYFPTNREPIYVSNYFKAFEFKNEDLGKMKANNERFRVTI